MVEFKFHIKCPIFVARQWLRHRTASVNEISARYSVIQNDYFVPDNLRKQSNVRGQGGDEPLVDDDLLMKQIMVCEDAFRVYDHLIAKGVSRELARIHLPQNTYTEFYWKLNLHNLLHFLHLRMEDHAQKEIQELASKVYKLIKPLCPFTCEAFEDFRLGSITLSRLELEALANGQTDIPGRGENQEFKEKLAKCFKDDAFIKTK